MKRNSRVLAPCALVLALPLAAPAQERAGGQDAPPPVRYDIAPADSLLRPILEGYALEGAARVQAWFGEPFPSPVLVRVFPDRASFDAHLRDAWGMPDVACWMVGGAEEQALVLLSPRVWQSEACDHDPDDADHVRDLVAHELVHVYHAQRNPTDEFVGVEGLDWFVEGVATLVSGQLERGHRARAREAVETGAAPAGLDDAWTGPYRYGVSGSLVAFVETQVGRDGLARLLAATTRAQVLDAVGLTEGELMAAWRAWVVREP